MKSLKGYKKLLIVVDMVNGFVNEGALADKNINHITPEIIRLVEHTLLSDEAVAFVKDTHDEDSQEFKSFPPHCIKGTEESQLIPELKLYEGLDPVLVYEKNSTSTMFAKGFLNDINKMENLNEVIIVGCCTDICITNLAIPLKNYFNELNKDVNIIVPENAVETYNSEFHPNNEWNYMAFSMMKQSGVEIVSEYKETDIVNEWENNK